MAGFGPIRQSFLTLPTSLKIWACFLVLFPFYFFRSGMPQVADFILMTCIVYVLMHDRLQLSTHLKSVLRPVKFFCSYTLVVAIAWFPFVSAPEHAPYLPFLFPLFYIYDALIVFLVFKLFNRFGIRFVESCVMGIFLSVLIQVLLFPITGGGATRNSLFFNNPNQLGYYSLIAMSIFLYGDRIINFPLVFKVAFSVSAIFLAAVSASKAVLIAVTVLFLVSMVDSGLVRISHVFSLIICCIVLAAILTQTEIGNELIERVAGRVKDIGQQSDDTLEMRGYDRLWNNPSYAVLGAGEGGWERFYDDPSRHYEMHSTFGTLLFSYGIPGSIAFFLFLSRAFRGSGAISYLYALPVFLYGLTHMGLRFSLFWVFFAVVAVCAQFSIERRLNSGLRVTVSRYSKRLI